MSLPIPKLRKLPRYEDHEFYNDPVVNYINNRLYKDRNSITTALKPIERSTIVVYPKDIEVIFGCSPKAALQFLVYVREQLALSLVGPVTPEHLCALFQLDVQIVLHFMAES